MRILPASPSPAFVSLAVLSLTALPTSVSGAQVPDYPVRPAAGGAQEYEDRYERERRDQAREEQEARHESDPCALGCVAHEGLQTRGIPDTPVVAVVHEASRDDGVLTLRLRFYNDGSEPVRLNVDPASGYAAFFVEAGGEKLHILKDEDGELEAKEALDLELEPEEMESWWAKFPAPAADVKKFDAEIPPVEPFREVPLTDD